MSGDPPLAMHISPLGDRAVVIQLGSSIDEATHQRVRAVCARLDERPITGMVEYVPAYASVVMHYDPTGLPLEHSAPHSTPYSRVLAALQTTLDSLLEETPPPNPIVEIPVCYGGEFGPDLDDVARLHGLSAGEVIQLHVDGDYLVYMIGFLPGFPYLGGLSERIATPRRSTPRSLVPPGSVGIGGRQTGVYPIPAPGGWHLIGRTPISLFLPDQNPPTLLRVGDRVRFHSISADEFRSREGNG
jgi:inhibitor of KinA